MKKAPCYQCKDRHFNCHQLCPEYLRYKAELEEEKAPAQHPADAFQCEQKCRTIRNMVMYRKDNIDIK